MQAIAKKQIADMETIKMAVSAKLDSAAYMSWIAPLKFEVCDAVLSVSAHNQFSADFVKSVYSNLLESVAAEFGLSLSIRVGVAPSAGIANDNARRAFVPAAPAAAPVASAASVSFDAFIASDQNAFAVSACKKMAAGAASFSPLFLYGPSGCGKSMLAGCIQAGARGRARMMTAGHFVSEFARALRDHSVFAFKDFCRDCDMFILDDAQTLSGKRATQEEFLHLILDLRAAGKNIVLTANAAPGALTGFDRRIQSLLASGLVADVSAPDQDTRRAMLMRAGVDGPVAQMLASRIGADGHLVNGVAKKIETYTELMGARVTADVAERLLSDVLEKNKTPLSLVKSMAEKLGVSYDAVCGPSRNRTVVRARQIMMSALKSATKLSLAEIGRLVGDRDHATVLYAIAQVEKLRASDLILGAEISQMIEECR